MFAFLRKIRRSLLGSHQFRKYLLYSIGEILLVVIGILIALEVNNLNQQRIARNEARQSLYQLLYDLNIQQYDVNQDLINHRNSLNSSYIILDYLDSQAEFHDSLRFHLHNITLDSYTYNFNVTYNQINFKELSNDSLRIKVQYLYEFLIPRVQKGLAWAPDISTFVNNYVMKHFKSHNQVYREPITGDLADFFNEQIETHRVGRVINFQGFEPLDYKSFRADEEFRTLLKSTMSFRAFKIIHLEEIQNQIKEIQELIEEELGEKGK